MKKYLLILISLISLLAFTACDKGGVTEVTVLAPDPDSELKEVKWLNVGSFATSVDGETAYWTDSAPDVVIINGWKKTIYKSDKRRCDYIKVAFVGYDPASSYNYAVWRVIRKKSGDSIEQSYIERVNLNSQIYFEYK